MKDFKEQFLSEYFIASTMVDSMMNEEEKKSLFFSLSQAFLIDTQIAKRLWEISQRQRVREIVTANDFNMYGRINQYITQIMRASLNSDEEESMIAVKGGAIEDTAAFELPQREDISKESIFKAIVFKAGEGCIMAMRLLAIMQIEGIYIDKDMSSGLKNLQRASKWNDVNASMLYLYYGKEDKERCCNRLLSVLEKRCLKDLAKVVIGAYGQFVTGKRDDVAEFLEKAFCTAVLDRDLYCRTKARIIFSDIMPLSNKEAIIFSMDAKQLHSPVCDLPLKLKRDMDYSLDGSAFENMIFQRPDEQEKILREAQNFDLCRLAGYMPMCLCSDSAVVVKSYIEAIKRLLPKANIEIIEVRGLGADDLNRGYNNVFVKSCDENKFNVYVMVYRGMIDAKVMEESLKFLQSFKRREFRLSTGVELDLSSILPICVCDQVNDEILKRYCHVINLADADLGEKRRLVDEILTRKAKLYGIEEISLEEDVRPSIEQLSADNIDKALDRAILAQRKKSDRMMLGMQMLGKIITDYKSNNKFGFGGSINEDK